MPKLKQIVSLLRKMLSQLKKGVVFGYFVFVLLCVGLITWKDKLDLHLFINQFHTSFLDYFFKYSTYLGDGVMFVILAVVVFLATKKQWSLVYISAGLLTLLIVQTLKRLVFSGTMRPVGVFGESNLHLVEGVQISLVHSFPSGHTTTAFAIFSILCFYFKKSNWQYLFFTLAVIAGFSRVYLSQHFVVDVLVGSILGILIAFVCVYSFYSVSNTKL